MAEPLNTEAGRRSAADERHASARLSGEQIEHSPPALPLRPTRLLIAVTCFIVYGSLYPFRFAGLENGYAALRDLIAQPIVMGSRGDVAGNILLFVPYGLLCVPASRARRHRFTRALFIASLGTLLALALQVAQLWLPGRVAATGDAVLNVIGIAAGAVLGALIQLGSQRQASARRCFDATLAPLLLVLTWIAYRWFPLVPTLDMQHIKDALKAPLLAPRIDPARVLLTTLAWIAWFQLVSLIAAREQSPRTLALLALGITLAQSLFVGNAISANNLVGLALAVLALRPMAQSGRALLLTCAGLFAALLVSGLAPFEFTASPSRFHWLPFSGFLDGEMQVSLLNLLEKSYLYGALVVLLHHYGIHLAIAACITAAWLGLIEFAQVRIVGRTAEISDPLLALCMAWAMGSLAGKSHRSNRTVSAIANVDPSQHQAVESPHTNDNTPSLHRETQQDSATSPHRRDPQK